jgi:hypothetical protein
MTNLRKEDPDGSPWSSWDCWQPTTDGGAGLTVLWSRAEEMRTAILEIATRTNVRSGPAPG